MKNGIIESIKAEQEQYYYTYILLRSGTWWLDMCMITFAAIYINVFNIN